MGKLSVIGAQRVKALEAMLDDNLKEELLEVRRAEGLSYTEAQQLALEDYGVYGEFLEMQKLAVKYNKLAEAVRVKTGITNTIEPSTGNYSNFQDYKGFRDLKERYKEGDYQKRADKLKEEYKKKKQRLWLCETLEEAKAIVGLE